LVAAAVTPAAASGTDQDDALAAIEAIVPDVLSDAIDVEAGLVTQAAAVEVLVPSDASDGITVSGAGLGELTLGLPFAEDATLVDAGNVVVYDNGNDSSTVPLVNDDGSVQVLTTITSADAPTQYAYPLGLPDGSILALTADGGAEVISGDGFVTTVIEAPWAYDANGNAVATHYVVDGDTMVQIIDHGPQTAYPVVADPKLTKTWWNTTIYFNRSETKRIGDRAPLATILAFVPSAIAKAVGAYLTASAGLFNYYYSNGQCGKMVSYGSGLGAYFPQQYGGSEAGGYCK